MPASSERLVLSANTSGQLLTCPLHAQTRHSGGSGPDPREMTEGDLCAGALGARVGREADELGALFPQAPGKVVVLGLVAGGDHLLVFDVLPGEFGGVVG